MSILYDKDFYAWANEQANLIREGKFSEIDVDNVAEEIESYAKREKQNARHQMRALLSLMLRWVAFPGNHYPPVKHDIDEKRRELSCLLDESPSLNPVLKGDIEKLYEEARESTIIETGLPDATFFVGCSWSFDQIMDENFWPDDTGSNAEKLKQAVMELSGSTTTAKLRPLMPDIDQKLQKGVRHEEIVAFLRENGIDVTLENFRKNLYHYRSNSRTD